MGRNVYPLITHLLEISCLEEIYNYVFWVFLNQIGNGLQNFFRDGNVAKSAMVHLVNAALCLCFIHF